MIKNLIWVKKELNQKGFDIKLWDCYRPFHIQKILYDEFPVKGYVADPIWGSIHNRGTAVDITLTEMNGRDIDMGSQFDDFSNRSHISYRNLPVDVLSRRELLHNTMILNNFVSIKMEWWHFEFIEARKYPKFDDPFPCYRDW